MKGCKNCPAFAKCIVIYRSSACEALRGTYGIDADPEIETNADRIRAMSDEELADLFAPIDYCSPVTIEPCNSHCKDCWIKWLKQPAEED